MSLFANLLKSFAPSYFQERWMSTLLESSGMVFDQHAQRVFDGRCAGNPYAGGSKTDEGILRQCEPEVLAQHAADRGITLYDTEPVASRRYRVSRWRDLIRLKGSDEGALMNAQPYFLGLTDTLPMMRIVHQSNEGTPTSTWSTMAAVSAASVLSTGNLGTFSMLLRNPSNFNFDDRPALWSRNWVFVYLYGTGLTPPDAYDDGSEYDDGSVYDGGTLTPQRCADIVAMFKLWKSSHDWLNGVALVWDNTSIDPTGTPTQDADGRWSLPNGANTWAGIVDPTTGLATRPANVTWIYDNNAP
jgi:hypothetical protein